MDDPKKNKRISVGPVLAKLLIGIFTYAALLTLATLAISPERYDLRAGEASPITITATKDVQDTVATQALIDEAVSAVQPHYVADATVQDNVTTALAGALALMESIRGWDVDPENITAATSEQAMQALSGMAITESDLKTLFSLSSDELSALAEAALRHSGSVLAGKVYEGEESAAVSKVTYYLMEDDFPQAEVTLISRAVANCMRANMLLDMEVTGANRQKAADAVAPVMYIKGQNIVRSGEIITVAQIAVLDSLGMLKDQRMDMSAFVGLALVIALMLALIYVYLYSFERPFLDDPLKLALLCTIMVTVVALCVLLRVVTSYIMPAALGAMMITLLIGPRLALMCNIALSVLAGLLVTSSSGQANSAMFAATLEYIIAGSASVLFLRKKQQRTRIMLAGLLTGALTVAVALAAGLINDANVLASGGWAVWTAASGILASILCIGLQPVLEWAFNVITPSKLYELSNPNHPLLRRMILEASGTYHHSIIVANLAETAANAIGVNGMLARVGAYYHDIGKLKRPLYFKENQLGDNPHDRTDPLVSTAILTSHPRDGVQLAQKHRLPQEIQDIIAQHHGDTPVLYFYDRYVKQPGAKPLSIDDFRYDGPRPNTAESAIIMLADTVEAAARALPDPTTERIDQLIRRLVRAKIDDEQLSECPLTLSDIDKICRAFLTVLNGVFHERVEYPTVKVPDRPLSIEDKPNGKEQPQKAGEPKPKEQPAKAEEAKPKEQPKAEEAKPKEQPAKAEEAKPKEQPKAEEAKPKEQPKAEEAKPKEQPKAEEAKPKEQSPKAEEAKPKEQPAKAEEVKPKEQPSKAEEAKPKEQTTKAEEAKPKEQPAKAEEAKRQ